MARRRLATGPKATGPKATGPKAPGPKAPGPQATGPKAAGTHSNVCQWATCNRRAASRSDSEDPAANGQHEYMHCSNSSSLTLALRKARLQFGCM